MISKVVNSKITAMLMGVWIAYCASLGDFAGVIVLLFTYFLLLWDLNTKKATSAGNTDGNQQ